MKFRPYGFIIGVAVFTLGLQASAHAGSAAPEKPNAGVSGLTGSGTESRWCTNSRATADAQHVYDPACPSSSAKLGADGKWHPQPDNASKGD